MKQMYGLEAVFGLPLGCAPCIPGIIVLHEVTYLIDVVICSIIGTIEQVVGYESRNGDTINHSCT